jgi:hypothetical protein
MTSHCDIVKNMNQAVGGIHQIRMSNPQIGPDRFTTLVKAGLTLIANEADEVDYMADDFDLLDYMDATHSNKIPDRRETKNLRSFVRNQDNTRQYLFYQLFEKRSGFDREAYLARQPQPAAFKAAQADEIRAICEISSSLNSIWHQFMENLDTLGRGLARSFMEMQNALLSGHAEMYLQLDEDALSDEPEIEP